LTALPISDHHAASDTPADACFAMAAMILVLGLLLLVGEVIPIGCTTVAALRAA